MTNGASTGIGLTPAFEKLSELVRAWRQQGRKTTTAGLKPALQRELVGFSETELGFTTFRTFVIAAAEAGYVKIEKTPTGHSWVMLPDETSIATRTDAEATDPTVRGNAIGPPPAATPGRSGPRHTERLKPDVWATFVDWRDSHRRMWDRSTRRSFMYPLDEAGAPAWITDPDRFVAIDSVEQATQIDWMREWAATLPDQHRDRIVNSLGADRPLGQFRKETTATGLASVWRAELQSRVANHARQWATEHDVPVHELIDHRPPTASMGSDVRVVAAARPPFGTGPAQPVVPPPEQARSADGHADEASQLRALLHRAIDRMSLTELLSIPVRAEHLLDR